MPELSPYWPFGADTSLYQCFRFMPVQPCDLDDRAEKPICSQIMDQNLELVCAFVL